MTIQKQTTAACQNLLPQVLIDYLWQLAGENQARIQTFILSPKYVGTSEVQEILHRRNNFSSWRRVFGYQPVEAVVEVHTTGQAAIMDILVEAPASQLLSA